MPFVLVFAVLIGAGGVIAGALAAPIVDPSRCKQNPQNGGGDNGSHEPLALPKGVQPPIAEE